MPTAKSLLLIEDNELDAREVKRALNHAVHSNPANTFNIVHHLHFREGLSALSTGKFDILLLDLGLPDISQENVLSQIETLHTQIPIVVFTGLQDKELAIQGIRRGAQDFLVKGKFSPFELDRCISYAIERHQLKYELLHAARELAQKSAILESIIDHMGDGVIVTDQKGRLLMANPVGLALMDSHHPSAPPAGKAQNNRSVNFIKQLPIGPALQGQPVDEAEVALASTYLENKRYVSVTARPLTSSSAKIEGCVAVLHDITKRRETEQLRNEFVSIVSHELRTPLTSINGALGLVLGGVTGNVGREAEEMISIAQNNTFRLLCLIDDLLDMQKLEAGMMDVEFRPLDLDAIIQKALVENEGYALKNKVTFAYRQQGGPTCTVPADETRILQVLANLLSNAAKYSPEKGVVTIEWEISNEAEVTIRVHDKGPGIPSDFQEVIFDKFIQADAAMTRKKGGTGLGLSICKSIIELHGGAIGFETQPGEGTTFYFTLPIDKVSASAPVS